MILTILSLSASPTAELDSLRLRSPRSGVEQPQAWSVAGTVKRIGLRSDVSRPAEVQGCAMTTESSETTVSRVVRRVGDVQRSACTEVLADAFVKGELSRVEFDARTELCLAAVTEADLAQLVADLPRQEAEVSVSSLARSGTGRGTTARLARFVGFELVLMVVAYILGVDLESQLRSWYLIAFEIWVVGNVAGTAGAFLLRPISTR